MRALTWDQVEARRLERSSLDARAPRERLLDTVRAICGAHAQLSTGAELSLSARVEDVTRNDIREALWQTRELVKAATLRTTLHLHPADDVSCRVEPFRRLTKVQRSELVAEAARVAATFAAQPVLEIV